ncbi:hypothetical protein ACFLXF_01055 [Chloroflexota bacterium]
MVAGGGRLGDGIDTGAGTGTGTGTGLVVGEGEGCTSSTGKTSLCKGINPVIISETMPIPMTGSIIEKIMTFPAYALYNEK